MRIFRNEILKILGSREVLLIFIIFVILNGTLFISEIDSGRFPAELYKCTYADLSEFQTNSERTEYLDEKIAELESAAKEGAAEAVLDGTDFSIDRQIFFHRLKKQIEDISNFQNRLEKRIADLDKSDVSIFSSETLFEESAKIRAIEDLSRLRKTRPGFTNEKSFTAALSFRITDLFVLVLILLLNFQFFFKDRQSGMLSLLLSYNKGRKLLAPAKLTALSLLTLLAAFVLILENLFIAALKYGTFSLSEPIQSIFEFSGSGLLCSIGEYMLIFFLAKYAAFLVFAFFCVVLTIRSRSLLMIFSGIGSALGFTAAIIRAARNFPNLREYFLINFFSLLDVNSLYKNYGHINIFNHPFRIDRTSFMAVVLSAVLLFVLAIFLYNRQLCDKTEKSRRHKRGIKRYSDRPVSLERHENYKLFITSGALFILFAVLGLQLWRCSSFPPPKSEDEIYYERYINNFEGRYDDTYVDKLRSEQQYFDNLKKEFSDLNTENEKGPQFISEERNRISYRLRPEQSFLIVRDRISYSAKRAENGRQGLIFQDASYKILAGKSYFKYREDFISALILILACICCLSVYYTDEWESRMIELINVSRLGVTSVFRIKLQSSLCFFIPAFLMLQSGEIFSVAKIYGLPYLFSSCTVKEIPEFSNFFADLPLWLYLLSLILLRFAGLLFALIIIILLSVRLKDRVTASIVSFLIAALPIAIYIMGISDSEYFLLNPFLSPAVLLNLWNGYGVFFYLIPPLLIFYLSSFVEKQYLYR